MRSAALRAVRARAQSCAVVVSIALLSAACAARRPARAKAPKIGEKQTGIASWYGYPYHGRQTASGEIYDMEKQTAAHRTYVFGTWLEVKRLDNGETVIVRVNDRGPFVRGRIIDLSRSAARSIGLLSDGIAKVRLEVIRGPVAVSSSSIPPEPSRDPTSRDPEARQSRPDASRGDEPLEPSESPEIAGPRNARQRFAVQVVALRDRDRAETLRSSLGSRFGSTQLVPRYGNVTLWRVLVGNMESEALAAELASQVGPEFPDAFVVRVDEP